MRPGGILAAEEPGSVDVVAEALGAGEVVVIPTDTVYGLAARADDSHAVARIFELKHRSKSQPIAVLVADHSMAAELGVVEGEAEKMVRHEWPGPLTVVVPRRQRAGRWELGGDRRFIGIRVPDHEFVLNLIRKVGPLAATSANISGEPPVGAVVEITAQFGDTVALYVDGGELRGRPSRVVSFIGDTATLRD